MNETKMKKLDTWIVGNDTGISSETIWACVKNVPIDRSSVPCDKWDFSRCHRLVDTCDITIEELGKVAKVYPEWQPLVDNWGKLTTLYKQEEDEKFTALLDSLGVKENVFFVSL